MTEQDKIIEELRKIIIETDDDFYRDVITLLKTKDTLAKVLREENEFYRKTCNDLLKQSKKQKAEIDNLEYDMELMKQEKSFIQTEAIKEFAEKIHKHCTSIELNEYIETVVEEMAGE